MTTQVCDRQLMVAASGIASKGNLLRTGLCLTCPSRGLCSFSTCLAAFELLGKFAGDTRLLLCLFRVRFRTLIEFRSTAINATSPCN